jgi:5-methylcytosine-specific restriction endonuclease McrA
VNIFDTLKKDYNKLKHIYLAKNEHFLKVDFDFYKKWKLIIKMIMKYNENYISCEIARKKFKQHNMFIVIGLKWSGKNVKRRTIGFAKEFVKNNKNAKCIYCEKKLTLENATADHVVPIALGGNNCQINIVVCCQPCNSERGTISFNDYIKNKNNKYKGCKYIFF